VRCCERSGGREGVVCVHVIQQASTHMEWRVYTSVANGKWLKNIRILMLYFKYSTVYSCVHSFVVVVDMWCTSCVFFC
jgi:hypothetical protein